MKITEISNWLSCNIFFPPKTVLGDIPEDNKCYYEFLKCILKPFIESKLEEIKYLFFSQYVTQKPIDKIIIDKFNIEDWFNNPYPEVQTDVHPTDTILHATVCHGYSGSDGIPHMAKTFVDYGATAFVGAIVDVPRLHNDVFTGAFWEALCQDDHTVWGATTMYMYRHNLFHDYPEELQVIWLYGDHIRIYGSTSARLDN